MVRVSERLMCARCGREGYDVAPKLVEVASPVLAPLPEAMGGQAVPERFVSQLRCLNAAECEERASNVIPLFGDDE